MVKSLFFIGAGAEIGAGAANKKSWSGSKTNQLLYTDQESRWILFMRGKIPKNLVTLLL